MTDWILVIGFSMGLGYLDIGYFIRNFAWLSFERAGDMADVWLAAWGYDDGDHIEPNRQFPGLVCSEVIIGDAAKFALLGCVDRGLRLGVFPARAGLDLHKHQHLPRVGSIECEDVRFPCWAAIIASQDFHPSPAKISTGELLAARA